MVDQPEQRVQARMSRTIKVDIDDSKGRRDVVGGGVCGERRRIFDMMMNTVHQLVITSSILSFLFSFFIVLLGRLHAHHGWRFEFIPYSFA